MLLERLSVIGCHPEPEGRRIYNIDSSGFALRMTNASKPLHNIYESMNMIKIDKLIYPIFVIDRPSIIREEITSMPGIFKFSPRALLNEIASLKKIGISSILLFGIPSSKDLLGSQAYCDGNLISRAVSSIKKECPEMTVMTDVCLCAYTTHGHCGILEKKGPGSRVRGPGQKINNKGTLEALAKIAISHAKAGADYVAPSAMADGQVAAIRKALDKNRYNKTRIMAYSAKFKSNFYGPFREAMDSAPRFGDRSAYQIDPADAKWAIREVKNDIKEGADIVMVKPALGYLDIVKEARAISTKPVAVYNVSGEYASIKSGAAAGLWDEKSMVFENMASIKRAGADIIITYYAKDIARWLKE